ncbi:MAG: type I 3-dehydroquinate dehydratase, partial [Treponema sp.]|nr:type I 3-dehydroquinate dehydratase [Treponema sp.]
LIRHFPELAGLPVILTIRRQRDGGKYSSGEWARINLLARGLAYAETDSRKNFAYVDIEEDLNVPSLEEAARAFGTRIIRSYHGLSGIDENIEKKLRSMLHTGDELAKVAVATNSTSDVLRVFKANKACSGQEKILICMGHYGAYSRILAEQFGSYLTYTSAFSETDSPIAAQGQFDVQEMAELYRLRGITSATKIYGEVGQPLNASNNPYFFNTVFEQEDIDAVYLPFPADSLDAFMELAKELGILGLSVTVPYKEEIIPYLTGKSQSVHTIGACNTLSLKPQGWLGTNTDIEGFSDSLLEFTGRNHLRRQRITLIGAGGAAKATAAELYRLGAKVLILNRTVHKARDLALPYKFAWGGLDSRGIEMMDKYRDIIIQATPAGMAGSDSADPLEIYAFSGHEEVMDLVYTPDRTPFLKRAAKAGCRVINGYDMLIRQARYQYMQFMGRDFSEQLFLRFLYDRSHNGTDRYGKSRATDERGGGQGRG